MCCSQYRMYVEVLLASASSRTCVHVSTKHQQYVLVYSSSTNTKKYQLIGVALGVSRAAVVCREVFGMPEFDCVWLCSSAAYTRAGHETNNRQSDTHVCAVRLSDVDDLIWTRILSVYRCADPGGPKQSKTAQDRCTYCCIIPGIRVDNNTCIQTPHRIFIFFQGGWSFNFMRPRIIFRF